ncbi:urea amidolyase [Pontibacillus halophilus JSM 076056 = DSM 19796]|uniref:Urea amidolyase n=1 Tax=Pontibacillus halophilus JSM 076056 = DSM 19796 TaxID=1385510 RepID=A0A0A5IDL1_9BACI|nr:biotin-dependent carboxyltransferase family protein [Pontibacillus halophilus]KGX93932.1 urea amidolyase [Pontibacillus halophilus JSM 076056 = DSM 19796]
MSSPVLRVTKPGLYTTVQDSGRIGFRSYGVPMSGAMDQRAYRIANLLINNKAQAPCLEITLFGTEFEVLSSHLLVVTGGNLDVRLNGESAPMWTTFSVEAGDRLVFKGPKSGVRAYLGVQSGFVAPVWLGSASTYEKGGYGQALRVGDVLEAAAPVNGHHRKGLLAQACPVYEEEVTLRVVRSRHEALFTPESLHTFYNETWTVGRGDRMGTMLNGEASLQFHTTGDILSEAVTYGTIQVTSSGDPIILMADSQTTGGYATIGTIVSTDLWKVAQLPQGGRIQFETIAVEDAHYQLKEAEAELRRLSKFSMGI